MCIRKLFLFVYPAIFVLFFIARAYADAEQLNLVWELLDGLNTPESVIYDEVNDVLYVSNINGMPLDKDGNGYISKVSLEGKMIKSDWVTGLHAPKGLSIHAGKLYVSDIDTLVEIDIESGQISNRFATDAGKFLNDTAAGEDGVIYVSDMLANTIYQLKDGVLTKWLESPLLASPNGLRVEVDRLVVGIWGVITEGFNTETPGHLIAISFKDKSITNIGDGTPIGNLDGVEGDIDGDYYVTDWMAGKLLHIELSGEVETLLTLEQGTADLEYIHLKDLIIIPMMNNDKLLAYKAHHYEK